MRKLLILTLLASTIWTARASFGQTPMGPQFRANIHARGFQGGPVAPAVGPAGAFGLAWYDLRDARYGGVRVKANFTVVRFFDDQGAPVTPELFPLGKTGDDHEDHPLAFLGLPSGKFELVAERDLFARPGGILQYGLQAFSATGAPVGVPSVRPQLQGDVPAQELVFQIVPLPTGDLWVLWSERLGLQNGGEVLASRMTADGQLIGTPASLVLDPESYVVPGGIGLDARHKTVVTWSADCHHVEVGDPYSCDVFAQKLSPQGAKLGEPVRLNSRTDGSQIATGVSVAPDGSFLAIWQSDSPYEGAIIGRHFAPDLTPTGDEFLVSPDAPSTFAMEPRIATDPAGRAVVIWANFQNDSGYYSWDVLARGYRPDGTEITRKPIRINQLTTYAEFPLPALSFGGNGTAVAVWVGLDSDSEGVFAGRFAFSPGDEACVLRDSEIYCNTGRVGGEAEFKLPSLGLQPHDKLVFGDADGDGRADPCIRRGRKLLCDTDHFGAPLEWSATFGTGHRGEEIFLADIDGDGRADVCAHEGSTWSCDTTHGGRADLVFQYGRAGERGFMADVDGDHRAEACVVRSNRLHCDTGHGQPGKETVLAFPAKGVPLVGDFDGDGRADACSYSGGTFRCNTLHAGGTPNVSLQFGKPGDVPLLVGLDGL